jgi:hypothetical protein
VTLLLHTCMKSRRIYRHQVASAWKIKGHSQGIHSIVPSVQKKRRTWIFSFSFCPQSLSEQNSRLPHPAIILFCKIMSTYPRQPCALKRRNRKWLRRMACAHILRIYIVVYTQKELVFKCAISNTSWYTTSLSYLARCRVLYWNFNFSHIIQS